MDEKFMENASALEQLHRDAALAATQRSTEKTPSDFDGVHCAEPDCGDEIPPARLAMGKFRCVTCQTKREKRRG